MDSKGISFYKNISIIIFILMTPCLLIDELVAHTGLKIMINMGLLGNLMLIVLPNIEKIGITKSQKRLLIFFFIGIVYFTIIGLTIYPGSGFTTKNPIKNYITIILIFFIINSKGFNIKRLTDLFINIAFIFSFFAVVQFALYFLNILQLNIYVLKTYSPGTIRYIGIGGFVDPDYLVGNFYRVESFWREPSRFAQFLQVPLFFSIYKFTSNKSLKNLIVLITLSSALVLTFSVANYFSFIIGIIVFLLLSRKDILFKYKMLRKLIPLTAIIILGYGIFYFFQYTNQSGYQTEEVLLKSTSKQLNTRVERFEYASNVLDSSIFGNPSIRKNWSRNPSALGMMLIWGGIPGVLLGLAYSFKFYRLIISTVRKSRYSIIYIGSIAFFIAFNWYGSYFDNNYLFLIALFTTYIKQEELGNEFI